MKTLISNTSFGELCKSKEKEFLTRNVYLAWYEEIRTNFDNFLKQSLKLEMFVPGDEDGNILKEPKRWEEYLQYPDSFDGNKEWDELYDYQQAKEKVLFVFKPHFDISVIKHHILQDRDIEYLANFGSMQLTKNALNAIFG